VIVTEWGKPKMGKLLQRLDDRIIFQWRSQLKGIVQQQGGHIEHLMRKL